LYQKGANEMVMQSQR